MVYTSVFPVIVIGLTTALLIRFMRSPWRKLPPGPRPLPVIGNLLQLREPQWMTFMEMRQRYGDLFYLNLAGASAIVISSPKIAIDLLDRRANKYSDRPPNIVAAQILSGGMFFGFARSSDLWRRMRKAAVEGLNKDIVQQYRPKQSTEAILLASSILETPGQWQAHLERSSASLIMSVVYGHQPISSVNDPSIKSVKDFSSRVTRAALPGTYLVEVFPWLVHIPPRLAKWRREAEAWFAHDTKMFEGLLDEVKQQMADGESPPSLAKNLIENAHRSGLSERENAWLAATMYAAGAESSSGVMAWCILALLHYPEVQKRAQAEIDAVVGRTRIPTFADFEQLPYIQALVKESLRWNPVNPNGVPHYTTEDDWYQGMFIPKGTICLVNEWLLNRNPELFGEDAENFNPARHLDAEGRIKRGLSVSGGEGHFSYGFGRRTCVGQYIANNSLFINIAVLLWAVTFEPKGEKGVPCPSDMNALVIDGIVVHPAPFACKITPRFPEAASIIAQERELLA